MEPGISRFHQQNHSTSTDSKRRHLCCLQSPPATQPTSLIASLVERVCGRIFATGEQVYCFVHISSGAPTPHPPSKDSLSLFKSPPRTHGLCRHASPPPLRALLPAIVWEGQKLRGHMLQCANIEPQPDPDHAIQRDTPHWHAPCHMTYYLPVTFVAAYLRRAKLFSSDLVLVQPSLRSSLRPSASR